MSEIAIVRTGTANLSAVRAAFRRMNVATRFVERPCEFGTASGLVLPGVGAFAAAMRELERNDWPDFLREFVAADRPFLAICLGLQLLCEESDESPGVRGLGIVPVTVGRFEGGLRVPQLGFNTIEVDLGAEILVDGYVYFANSFRLANVPSAWKAAWSDYGTRFVAAIEKGNTVACQFHPELSGRVGKEIMARWVARVQSARSVSGESS